MPEYKIGNRTFRNRESFEAGKRDANRIKKLEEMAAHSSMSEKKELLAKMEAGRYSFETILGSDYIELFRERFFKEENSHQKKGMKKKAQTGQASEKKAEMSSKKDRQNRRKMKEDAKMEQKEFQEYDHKMQTYILWEMQKRETRRKRILQFCGVVAAICFGLFLFQMYSDVHSDLEQQNMVEQVENTVKTRYPKKEVHLIETTETEEVKKEVLPQYEKLLKQNENLIGWIKVDGTKIDYPVVQTDDREYYLSHSFSNSPDKNGCIFMDPDCRIDKRSMNVILYGHHMRSGKMFGELDKYAKESFYKEHPTFRFDTIYEEGTYEVLFAFRSKVYYQDEIAFKYYQFIDAVSESEFESNIQEMRNMALYETAGEVSYTDRLLTLSTCDSSEPQGRFVVVARKIQ